jgi:hypothetical protein
MNAAKERASPKRPPKQRTNSESARPLAENETFRHGQSMVGARLKVKRQGAIALHPRYVSRRSVGCAASWRVNSREAV